MATGLSRDRWWNLYERLSRILIWQITSQGRHGLENSKIKKKFIKVEFISEFCTHFCWYRFQALQQYVSPGLIWSPWEPHINKAKDMAEYALPVSDKICSVIPEEWCSYTVFLLLLILM